MAALLAAYTVLALVIVDYTMLLGTARTRAIGTAGLLGSVFACGLLIAGSVSESLLVVATSRLVYALVWAAGLRRQVAPHATGARAGMSAGRPAAWWSSVSEWEIHWLSFERVLAGVFVLAVLMPYLSPRPIEGMDVQPVAMALAPLMIFSRWLSR